MAKKKQLIERWHVEPGRSIAARIRQILLDWAEATRLLEFKAYKETGLYLIPKEWLPAFDTKVIFDLLEDLPFREEVTNGRDLRGIPSIGGGEGEDFTDTDFSFLPGTEGYSFRESILDGAIFDGSKGEFDFLRGALRKVRFRKVHFVHHVYFGCDCLDCDFASARVMNASFSEGADLRGSSFVGAKMEYAGLRGCDLRGCNFQKANLKGACIREAIIDKTTDFRGSDITGLQWQDYYDNSGKLYKRGSDWRQGMYDSTTVHD